MTRVAPPENWVDDHVVEELGGKARAVEYRKTLASVVERALHLTMKIEMKDGKVVKDDQESAVRLEVTRYATTAAVRILSYTQLAQVEVAALDDIRQIRELKQTAGELHRMGFTQEAFERYRAAGDLAAFWIGFRPEALRKVQIQREDRGDETLALPILGPEAYRGAAKTCFPGNPPNAETFNFLAQHFVPCCDAFKIAGSILKSTR